MHPFVLRKATFHVFLKKCCAFQTGSIEIALVSPSTGTAVKGIIQATTDEQGNPKYPHYDRLFPAMLGLANAKRQNVLGNI